MARSSEAGFSMIEMLVAMTLFGFLSIMLIGGLHLGTRVMETGAKRIDQTARTSSGYEFLRREIAQAQPLPRLGEANNAAIEFDGTSDSMTFITLASPLRAAGGYQQLALHPMNGSLVATWRPYVRVIGDTPAGERDSVLFGDVVVEFTYYGALANETAPSWHREWRNQAKLPALIGIDMRHGDGRPSPGLMIAPRIVGGPVVG